MVEKHQQERVVGTRIVRRGQRGRRRSRMERRRKGIRLVRRAQRVGRRSRINVQRDNKVGRARRDRRDRRDGRLVGRDRGPSPKLVGDAAAINVFFWLRGGGTAKAIHGEVRSEPMFSLSKLV
jgi:hypothetical protein